jgi:transcriptional regulator with XRE-family HTH domain
MEQSQLAELVGVDRRTIIRIEADETEPTNPRRRKIYERIRAALEKDHAVKFVFSSTTTGEGVVMKRGK